MPGSCETLGSPWLPFGPLPYTHGDKSIFHWVSMDSLKYRQGPPCPTSIHPAGDHPWNGVTAISGVAPRKAFITSCYCFSSETLTVSRGRILATICFEIFTVVIE